MVALILGNPPNTNLDLRTSTLIPWLRVPYILVVKGAYNGPQTGIGSSSGPCSTIIFSRDVGEGFGVCFQFFVLLYFDVLGLNKL